MLSGDIKQAVASAINPEDVFGMASGTQAVEQVKKVFRDLAKVLHPDKSKLADGAFVKLKDLYTKALAKCKAGTYGDVSTLGVKITSGKKVYTLNEVLATGDVADVYACAPNLAVKLCRTPANNGMLKKEAELLRYLHQESPVKEVPTMKHIPELVDSFEVNAGGKRLQANVFKRLEGFYSLAQVKRVHGTLDLRDAAWMFNRILGALTVLHQADYVHGAITLDHVMICPQDHNGVLVGYGYAVRVGEVITRAVPMFMPFYPSDILAKQPATTGMDLHMAATLLVALTGPLPRQVDGLVKACQLGPKKRIQDVFELFHEFKAALSLLYGKPKFRVFSMVEK